MRENFAFVQIIAYHYCSIIMADIRNPRTYQS